MSTYKLIDLLKIDYPIIQAPTAGSDSAELVAASCNAGILGSLGAQYLTPTDIDTAIKKSLAYRQAVYVDFVRAWKIASTFYPIS